MKFRPQPQSPDPQPKFCAMVLGRTVIFKGYERDVICGRKFFSTSRTAKFCAEHSKRVEYTGKGSTL